MNLTESFIADEYTADQIALIRAAMDANTLAAQHAAVDFDKLATSILAKEKPRMKLHPEALTRQGRRHPLHNTVKTPKQIRKEYAAEVAQARGLAPDARTYFRAVQTVKAEYERRTAAR